MQIIKTISDLRQALKAHRQNSERIALVPTMGALHEGHLSLVRLAKKHADCVVMSVFVNPTQFNDKKDLATYPRDLEADIKNAEAVGVDLVFAPEVNEMYPQQSGISTSVQAGDCAEGLCGSKRPGHFNGVVTVVSMLFNIVNPDYAVFGEKDYQQLMVIRQMVDTMHYPIEIIAAPIIREESGLALSSRNQLLSTEDKKRACIISKTLFAAQSAVKNGESSAAAIKSQVESKLKDAGFIIDYVEVMHPTKLHSIEKIEGGAQLLVAVFLGEVRLIDNVRL